MAILSKIRERSVFLILIIGLALLAFVLDPSSIQSFFQADKVNAVGQINGETISRENFAKEVENYKANSGGRGTNQQAMNYAWNKLVGEKVYADQLEKAGIVVGEEDLWNAIINMQYFQTNPAYKNEAGLFDEEKVKDFIAGLKDDAIGAAAGSQEQVLWQNWLATETSIRKNLENSALNNLVGQGLGASLKEGEREYQKQNTKVTSQFVYVPYTSIADSLVTLTNADYKAYISEHSNEYQVEESRDVKFVKFDIVASQEDKNEIKATVAGFIEDNAQFGSKGLKNAENIAEFFDDAKSDIANNDTFVFKNKLPSSIANNVFDGAIGDVFGPYEEKGFFKISKIVATTKLPDSVKSRHIIIPYLGSTRSNSTKTKEAAKKTADSVYALVKNSSTNFIKIADEINSDGTKGKGGDIGWITKDAAFSPNFDLDFANYLFENKKGSVEVVETKFGFHIIKIDEVKNIQDAVKLATFGREILPSADTENKFYQDAETFASNLTSSSDIFAVAKENSYRVGSGVGIKALDESVPGISSNQRQIVIWAFSDDTDINDVKRFDVDNGYVVVTLAAKTPKGLAPVSSVINKIRPILLNKKKAAMISKNMQGSSLADIAANSKVNVRTASNVTLASPTLSGVGSEPNIVGAMIGAKQGEVFNNIEGKKGVFAIQVTNVVAGAELPNYESSRNLITGKLKERTNQLLDALKESYEIEDYRAAGF